MYAQFDYGLADHVQRLHAEYRKRDHESRLAAERPAKKRKGWKPSKRHEEAVAQFLMQMWVRDNRQEAAAILDDCCVACKECPEKFGRLPLAGFMEIIEGIVAKQM